MKKHVFILVCLLTYKCIKSQGIIYSFTVEPSAPTISDYIKVYAEVRFNNSPCTINNKSNSTAGNQIAATAHHCLGATNHSCNYVDTFDVGYMTSGNKVFKLTLTSGFGSSSCTAGFVPDDIDSVSFFVAPSVGLNERELNAYNKNVVIVPNPFSETATIHISKDLKLENASFKVFDVQGKMVQLIDNIQFNQLKLERHHLINGIYFYQLIDRGQIFSVGKLVIE